MTKRDRAAIVTDSRQRFLAAADKVYVREGYDGATIRAITAEAGTSLARLNRHWNGKQDLFAEVFNRHFQPIHDGQNARFDALEVRDGEVSPVGDILDAFYSPAMLGTGGKEEQHISHMVYCRALTDPSPEASALVLPFVQAIRLRLLDKLRMALSDLDDESFFLVSSIVLGAYVYPQTNGPRLASVMGVDFGAIDWTRAGKRIATLIENGLGALSRKPSQR